MRVVFPFLVFLLAVSASHTVLSACLESAEKGEQVAEYDGLAELKKIDREEFEAAQREQAAQKNVTVEEDEKPRYLETDSKGPGRGGNSDTADLGESQSASYESEEHGEIVAEAVSYFDEVSQKSSEEQDESQ